MEYKIVRTMSWKELESDVKKLINEGWIPQGGATKEKSGHCIQAIIRK